MHAETQYDRPLDDIFEVQSEVTEKIAAALAGTSGALAVAERASVRRKPPASLQAYDYYVLGQELWYQATKDTPKAEAPLKKAIELDPQFERAYVALGHLYNAMASWGWGNEDANTLMEKAKAVLSKAIILDPTDAFAHVAQGLNDVMLSDYDHGFAEFKKAYALNPNDPDVLVKYGGMLYIRGRSRGRRRYDQPRVSPQPSLSVVVRFVRRSILRNWPIRARHHDDSAYGSGYPDLGLDAFSVVLCAIGSAIG